jgi:hypothetical protein
MINTTIPHSHECKCFSWKPIIAGAVVAIALTFLLNLFSVAISLTAYTTSDTGVETLAIGGFLGYAIGIIASMFAAGWLAGYLGKRYCTRNHTGALYGFLTWGVALIVSIFLMSHAVEYVAFYSHFISGTLAQMAAEPANKVAQTVSQMDANSVVVSTFVLFVLFFLGAFSASLGGHCGMVHRCKDETV